MMKKVLNIKIPSHLSSVNVPNIRRFIENLDKLDEPFVKKNLQNIKELRIKSKGARGRLLSYQKYLGVVSENRIKKQINNKKVTIRQYYLTDLGKELLQAKLMSPSKFEDKWREILMKSDLYKVITENNEFKENGYISRTAFRELILDGFSKNVTYIKKRLDKSEKFLRLLLKDGHVLIFDGEFYKPIEYKNINSNSKENYVLHINETGFELKIKDWDDVPPELITHINKYIEYKKSHDKTKNFEGRKK